MVVAVDRIEIARGMVKEYQVVVDPNRLLAAGVTLAQLRSSIEAGNGASGGSVVEMAEGEYMVRASGYVRGVEDLEAILVRAGEYGVPLTVGDLADVRIGPELRRGIAELDGDGEVVGGVVIMRDGENARATIADKGKADALAKELPAGSRLCRPTTARRSLTGLFLISAASLQEFPWC
jgi:Cu(I)/Ag(I) efflux system membrane protein CusA/SilA